MDRTLGSTHPKHNFIYPINYGFVLGTKAPYGSELDVYVLGEDKPLKEFPGKCIAIIHRLDDDDDKLIVCSENKSFTNGEIRKLTHFQEQWFESEIVREDVENE